MKRKKNASKNKRVKIETKILQFFSNAVARRHIYTYKE